MINNILNLEGVAVLNKKEQSIINGGGSGACRVYVNNPNGGSYWSDNVYTVAQAQHAYNTSQPYDDGSHASGYCCASCGEPGFSNAPAIQ